VDMNRGATEQLEFPSEFKSQQGRAIAETVSRWLPTAAARVRARVGQVGFVVDKVKSGQVFSEYFGFPCQKPSILPNSSSSQLPGAGIIGQKWATCRVDPVWTPPSSIQIDKK
jgi:hypothetical protein